MSTNPVSTRKTNWRRWLRIVALTLAAIVALGLVSLIPGRPLPLVPTDHPLLEEKPFDDFVLAKKKQSAESSVRSGNDEKFVRRSDKPTRLAFLYIHGFGASRAEGEGVVDKLSEAYAANTYYVRLPGHGADKEAHLAAKPEEYFATVEEAFHRFRPLGEKLVICGSSLGGLLSVWLAARHPREVDGIVVANPFFDFADPMSFLISRRMGMPIIETIYGKERFAGWSTDPEHRRVEGYEAFWITTQYFRALNHLDDLRRTMATPSVVNSVRAPMLMFYYYADEEHQDRAASIPAMHHYFGQTGEGSKHPLSREVAIADGNHILFSDYVRTDKETVLRETRAFIDALMAQKN